MAEAGGGGSDYRLSATLLLNDMLSGKLKSVASQLKSIDGAASRLGANMNGEVARLARQFSALTALRGQAEQFKELKKSIAATQQTFNQANANTAQLARQYKQGQGVVSQLKAKHDDLNKTFNASQSATAQLKTQLGDLRADAAKLKGSGARDEYQKLQAQIQATSAQLKASQATTRNTGAELKTLAGGIKQAQRELGSIGKAFDESKAKASKLKQELIGQRPVLERMRRDLAAQGFNTRDFVQSERDLRQRLGATAQGLLNAQSGKPISVNVSGNATSQLGKIRSQLQSLTSKAWNVAVNAKNAVGGQVSDAANGVLLGMGAPLLGTMGLGYSAIDIVKTYKDFEYEMQTVSAITGAYRDPTGQRLAELTDFAKHYGETTMFKASEVASAEKYMAMAGWSDEYIKAGLKPMLDLAAAAGEDLRRTSDIVTDAMTAFHLHPDEMYRLSSGKMVGVTEHFADVMAAMATSSNTDVNMAGEAAKYAGGIIGVMYSDQGIQDRMQAMEDWAILTGVMANSGIKASMAGTSSRAIFTRLASMQMHADAAREVLGVDLVYQQDDDKGHLAGQMRAPLAILDDISKRFKEGFTSAEDLIKAVEFFEGSGTRIRAQSRRKIAAMLENAQKNGGKLSKKDVLAMASMLSGQEALSGLLAYVAGDDKDKEKVIEAVRNSDGRASEMANVKMDTLVGDLQTLQSAWEAFQLEIMEGKGAEGFRNFTKGLTEDIRSFKRAISDGFDIGDIGELIARVVTQLKNKFLEFDGIGSILAGGALVMGMKKVYGWALKLKNAAIATRGWWLGAATAMNGRGTPPTTARTGAGLASSVSSMVVHAGSVVVNGPVASKGVTASTGAPPRTVAGAPPVGTPPRPVASTTPVGAPPATGAVSRLGTVGASAGFAGLLTGIFAIFDTYSTRSINANNISEAQAAYDAAKQEYQDAQEYYDDVIKDSKSTNEEIESAAQLLRQATEHMQQSSDSLKAIQKDAIKHNNEAFLGGTGAVAGAATGAALGSIIPGLGTLAGGIVGAVLSIIGGIIGSEVGKKAGSSFEFDIIDKIFGRDKKEPDWMTSDGRMFSELSYEEKVKKYAHMTDEEQQRMNDAYQEDARKEAKYKEMARNMPSAEVLARHRADAPEKPAPTPENLENKIVIEGKLTPAELESLNHQRGLAASAQAGLSWQRNDFSSVGDYFKGINDIVSFFTAQANPFTALGDFLFSGAKRAEAAELTPEQLAQQAAMERGEVVTPNAPESNPTDLTNLEGMTENLYSQLEQLGEGVNEVFTNMGTTIQEGLTSAFEGANEIFTNFGTTVQEGLTNTLTSASETLTSFGTTIQEGLTATFTNVGVVFTGLGEQIGTGLATAQVSAETSLSMIKASFDSGLQEIQTAWGNLPGFFDGIFAGLGGAASAAGSAIAAGLTAPIGSVIAAWEGAAAQISSIISNISAMSASVPTGVGGGVAVGHNATGTQSWRGGFTEINEQGGEIINLPSGTKIYPHATTMRMLQQEIQNGTFNDFVNYPSSDLGIGLSTYPTVNQSDMLSAFPIGYDYSNLIYTDTFNNSSSNTQTTNNKGVTISGNTFNIRKETDLDEIAFRLLELMTDSNANYAGA